MIAHRRGRVVTIAEDVRRPIRLAPRATYLSDNVYEGSRPLTPERRRSAMTAIERAGCLAPGGSIGV